ncbi:tyrosine-type recombinase/integrase [Thioclava kandeliae]|uniref:Core-binding (CB) domain-containing protein n=1 Tax=Thioclava kandeliae TaxID=3070818 RepID=A0ABV1SLL1_9RHOB
MRPPAPSIEVPPIELRDLTKECEQRLIGEFYQGLLHADIVERDNLPSPEKIEYELERFPNRAGEVDPDGIKRWVTYFNDEIDYNLVAFARLRYENRRKARYKALKKHFREGETKLVDETLENLVAKEHLNLRRGSTEWRNLAMKLMSADIEALEQTFERDEGKFYDTTRIATIQSTESLPHVEPERPLARPASIKLMDLFYDFVASRQLVGALKDGGRDWRPCVQHLIDFVEHDDARKVSKADLLKWRDGLFQDGKSAKTVSGKYLAAIRALFKWAKVNDILEHNPLEEVRQETRARPKTRERGFRDAEATKILQASLNYVPKHQANPANRESAHMTAAKRWVPLLCAFTGARVAEITQLRKEDVRWEGEHLVIRITPEAGSVKNRPISRCADPRTSNRARPYGLPRRTDRRPTLPQRVWHQGLSEKCQGYGNAIGQMAAVS